MSVRLRNPLRQPLKSLHRRLVGRLGAYADRQPKVFGVGLSRTGTKSLNEALRILGYRSDHFSTHILALRENQLIMDRSAVASYDALTDVTAARFYRELDDWFPGSRFILTVRDPQTWLNSCERHFPELRPGRWPHGVAKVLRLREEMYGARCFDRERFLDAYRRHREGVEQHFRQRPNDLLVLDITASEGWRALCAFLGLPEPLRPFPWANRTRDSGTAPIVSGGVSGADHGRGK